MFDTVRVQWNGIRWDDDFKGWVRSEWPTAGFSLRYYDVDLPWEGMTLEDTKLGTIGVKSNKRGNYLWAERSLPKYLHGDNKRLLSSSEALEAATSWVADVEARFASWWALPSYHEHIAVKRLDLCYQQQVPCSSDVFVHIARALKARRVTQHMLLVPFVQLHLAGVSYNQNRFERARWYDKGVESGDEQFINTVRHEEQLRAGKAGGLLDLSGPRAVADVEKCIERMNNRYQDWGCFEGYDLASMVKEHGLRGAAAVPLINVPEYETLFQQCLPRSTYFKVKALAMETRRKMMPVDLRLPVGAWAEPMVL